MHSSAIYFLTLFAVIGVVYGQDVNATTHVLISNTTIVCPSISVDALQRSNNELKSIIMEMWNSFSIKLNALEARLACMSNCSVPEVDNTTTVAPAVKYDQKIYRNFAIGDSWRRVYDQPYSHATSSANLRSAEQTCTDQVLVGARYGTATTLAIAAIGPKEVLLYNTTLNNPVRVGDVYWYSTSPKSFGFSAIKDIKQNSADQGGSSAEFRLSWHLDQANGGYRAGSTESLNNDTTWRKQIFCIE